MKGTYTVTVLFPGAGGEQQNIAGVTDVVSTPSVVQLLSRPEAESKDIVIAEFAWDSIIGYVLWVPHVVNGPAATAPTIDSTGAEYDAAMAEEVKAAATDPDNSTVAIAE